MERLDLRSEGFLAGILFILFCLNISKKKKEGMEKAALTKLNLKPISKLIVRGRKRANRDSNRKHCL